MDRFDVARFMFENSIPASTLIARYGAELHSAGLAGPSLGGYIGTALHPVRLAI